MQIENIERTENNIWVRMVNALQEVEHKNNFLVRTKQIIIFNVYETIID